jgi:phosphomannomutase
LLAEGVRNEVGDGLNPDLLRGVTVALASVVQRLHTSMLTSVRAELH